jgi:hypothetical protein
VSDPCPGGWLDPATRLCWQITPEDRDRHWSLAITHCAGLRMNGAPMRVPTITELRSIIVGCDANRYPGGTCGVVDPTCLLNRLPCYSTTICPPCYDPLRPLTECYWPSTLGGACAEEYTTFGHWSISESGDGTSGRAWAAYFSHGTLQTAVQSTATSHRVRCVQGPVP